MKRWRTLRAGTAIHIFHTRVFVLKLKTGRFVMQDLGSKTLGDA